MNRPRGSASFILCTALAPRNYGSSGGSVLEEIRGRVQQLLTQSWGLATAPPYCNAILIMFSSIVGGASGFVLYLIIARFYAVSDLGYAPGLFNTLSLRAT